MGGCLRLPRCLAFTSQLSLGEATQMCPKPLVMITNCVSADGLSVPNEHIALNHSTHIQLFWITDFAWMRRQ